MNQQIIEKENVCIVCGDETKEKVISKFRLMVPIEISICENCNLNKRSN